MKFELQIRNVKFRQPFQFSTHLISTAFSRNKIKPRPCKTSRKIFLFRQIKANTLHFAGPFRKTRHNPRALSTRLTGTPIWKRPQVRQAAHLTPPAGNSTTKICVRAHSKEHYYTKAGCPAFLKGANEGLNHLFIWNTRHSVGGMGEISLYFCGLIVCYFKFCLHP